MDTKPPIPPFDEASALQGLEQATRRVDRCVAQELFRATHSIELSAWSRRGGEIGEKATTLEGGAALLGAAVGVIGAASADIEDALDDARLPAAREIVDGERVHRREGPPQQSPGRGFL